MVSPCAVRAQFFQYSYAGDTLAGFRKTGQFAGNYELVVNLGNITNFLKLAPGTQRTITAFTPSQLSDAFPDGFQDLQWSVFSTFFGAKNWTNALGIFPDFTCWYTLPRTDPAVQTDVPNRFSASLSSSLCNLMQGVGDQSGAARISAYLAVTNTDNNATLVREPISPSTSANILTAFIGDISDPTLGDFGGNSGIYTSVENMTPDTFTDPTVSDLYESAPASSGKNVFVDPFTGMTNGPDYYVGSFTFNPDGTMTFTRASNVVAPPPPPPAPSLVSVTVAPGTGVSAGSNVVTIYFTTTNGPTYTLYYTNSAGLTAPLTNWASVPLTVTGNGLTNSIMDTSRDANRFYRVGVH